MREWVILTGMLVAPAIAFGACGPGRTVRDWGLHRAWEVARNCDHPERPAALVEVPWSVPEPGASVQRPDAASVSAPVSAPEVRSGMRVTVWRREANSCVRLSGVAMGTARLGERVKVRAGLGAASLDGIVRGPAQVELVPAKEGR